MDEYIVEPNDNLFSVSLKTNTRLYTLQRLNGLSEESILMPGMRIKLRGIYRKLSDTLSSPEIYEKEVAYCTSDGEILGKIQITSNSLTFQPSSGTSNSLSVNPQLSKYNLLLHLGDVLEVNVLDNCDIKPREHMIFVQVNLTATGHEETREISAVPKASIYFKVIAI